MADKNLDKRDPLAGSGKKPTIDPGAAGESENKLPSSGTEDFTDPSTSGGATAEDQDSATGQHNA
jgi:hypothetical protein